MSIALALDALVPGAAYYGSLTDDSKASFDALVWHDGRAKPTWDQVLAWKPSPPPPGTISRRQFFQQLAIGTIITEAEAQAAMGGTIPPELLTLVTGLPPDQQFAAKMLVAGATEFDIRHPVTLAIAQAYGWSVDQLSLFWIAASAL